jgi:NitT/TauT family transport system substrate-binding protein
MAKTNTRWQIVGAALLSLLLIASCSSDGDDDASSTTQGPTTTSAPSSGGEDELDPLAPQPLAERTTVNVSIANFVEAYAGLILASELGEFEAENLDVVIQRVPSNDALALLLRGDIQMLGGGPNAGMLNSISGSESPRCTGAIYDPSPETREGVWVRNDALGSDGEADPELIRGRQIAAGSGIGTSPIVPVVEWLESIGLGLDDVEIVGLASADAQIAFEQGSVVAAFLQTPLWQQVEEAGFATYIEGSAFSLACYVMSSQFIEGEPEAAEAVLRALLRTHREYLQGDYHTDDEVLGLLSTALEVPADVIAASPPFAFTDDLRFSDDAIEVISRMEEIWLQEGSILTYTEPIGIDRIFDDRFASALSDG